jgi:hypothetical protein
VHQSPKHTQWGEGGKYKQGRSNKKLGQQSALREVEQHTDTHTARLTSRRREHDSQASESPRPRAIVKQCIATWEELEGRGRHESVDHAASSLLALQSTHALRQRLSAHTQTHTHTLHTHTRTLSHMPTSTFTHVCSQAPSAPASANGHTCELCCCVVTFTSHRQIMQLARRFTDLRHPFVDTFSHTQRTRARHHPSAGSCREAHSPCCPVCFCALLAEIPASALALKILGTQKCKGGVPLR